MSEMTLREAAAKGGRATLEKHGVGHFRTVGAKGGAATRAKHGPEFYSMIGRKGGMARVARSREIEAQGKAQAEA